MPAALDVDREAVKTLAVAIGVREAARKMGLPESTVQTWSERYEWFKKPVQPPTVLRATNATKPSVALATVIADNSSHTRVSLSEIALKGARAMAKRPGEVIATVKQSQTLRNLTDAAGKIGGWDENKDKGGVNVMVNVGILGQ